jgi:hypothetical protein
MKYQIGAMSVGDILDRGLKLLFARLPAFYSINLIVLAPILALQIVMPLITGNDGSPDPLQALSMLGGGLLVLVLMLILQPIGTAAILRIISKEFVDERATVGEAFSFAFQRFGRLLGASILAGLVIGLGFLLCFVPGVFFSIWYVFIAQVVVVENRTAADALSRSKQLGEGFRGRIFGLFCLVVLLSLLAGFVAMTLQLVLPSQELVNTVNGPRPVLNFRNHALGVTISTLLNILVQTYGAVCWTLLYFDLRIRKEGFDLELAAKPQGASPV